MTICNLIENNDPSEIEEKKKITKMDERKSKSLLSILVQRLVRLEISSHPIIIDSDLKNEKEKGEGEKVSSVEIRDANHVHFLPSQHPSIFLLPRRPPPPPPASFKSHSITPPFKSFYEVPHRYQIDHRIAIKSRIPKRREAYLEIALHNSFRKWIDLVQRDLEMSTSSSTELDRLYEDDDDDDDDEIEELMEELKELKVQFEMCERYFWDNWKWNQLEKRIKRRRVATERLNGLRLQPLI